MSNNVTLGIRPRVCSARSKVTIAWIWIPRHCGIYYGNEKANNLMGPAPPILRLARKRLVALLLR